MTSVDRQPEGARVKSRDIYVTEVKEGDVLVVQGALIREDGSHKLPVIKVERSERFVWLTISDGRRIRYSRYTKVNLGIVY